MRTRLLISIALMIGLFLWNPSTSRADDWNRLTTIEFDHSFQVSGVVLPAGIYVFKVMDDVGNHNIVQIWNADQTVLHAIILGYVDYLREPPRDNLFIFEKLENDAKDAPVALKCWFYERNPSGVRFVYPKKPEKGTVK